MKRFLLFLLLFLLPSSVLADLEVHFLDVGHGDCTIITCDGEAMIIDGGNAGCSQLVYNYLTNHGITDLKYAVATHPDADHIGGLPAAFHAAKVQMLLSPIESHDEKRFDKLTQTAQEQSVPLAVPEAGDVFSLGNATITVISPVIKFADTNDMSLVLRIDYNENSFLFTGDASTAVERDLISRKVNLDADVLKVSHHGSSTGTSDAFVSEVSPDFAVISCSGNSDSPSWEVLYTLADTCTLITAQKGTIVLHSDGTSITVQNTISTVSNQEQYVGNANSKVFHVSTCESVSIMKDKNKVYFDTIEQAEGKGYRPCKNCSP